MLLTPGAWATDYLKAAAPALRLLRAAKGQLVPVSLERPLGPNIHAPGFYLTRRMEDDVVLGATMEFDRFDRRATEGAAEELLAAAELVLPGEVRRRERGWAGIRPMSPDGGRWLARAAMFGWPRVIRETAGCLRR